MGKQPRESEPMGIERPEESAAAGKVKPEQMFTIEDSHFIAGRLVAVMNALGPEAVIRIEAFRQAVKQMEAEVSRYESIGMMFDPMGHEAKFKYFKQGIKKLKALVMLCEAEYELADSKVTARRNNEAARVLGGIIGQMGGF